MIITFPISMTPAYLILVFSVTMMWTACTEQNIITGTQHTPFEGSSSEYQELRSSLECNLTPILTDIHEVLSESLDLTSKETHKENPDIVAQKDISDVPWFQILYDTYNSQKTSQFLCQDIPQLNAAKTNPAVHTDGVHVELVRIEQEPRNDADKTLSQTTNNLARQNLHMIYHHLNTIEVNEAKKIWNIKTILPFVYFSISCADHYELSNWSMRYAACLFVAYHKKFLSPYKEIDYKSLCSFLVWMTDIFHRITSPRLIFDSSMGKEYEQIQELGRMRDAHPVVRLLLELRGFQPINPSLTSLGHKHNQYFTIKFIEIWEKDMKKQSIHQRSLTQVASIWEDWNSKAEQIMAHGETLDPLILPASQTRKS